MSIVISRFVVGLPKGQPRPRAFARGGKARVYDPGTAEGWKSEIALAFLDVVGPPLAGPLVVKLDFNFPRPKAHTKKDGTLRPGMPQVWHVQKPDVDNLAKAVLDALTTIGLWHDDAQVAVLEVSRKWSWRGGALIQVGQLIDHP